MCGVLGILGDMSLAEARDLLLLLTHRGQDASGLLWSTPKGFVSAKAIGSPANIDIDDARAQMVLGSTRYPTSGREMGADDDLERFVGPFHRGEIALTHNGNITNVVACAGRPYDCDTEFLTERLEVSMKENGDLVSGIRRLEQEIDGAYSIIGIYDQCLFAFRDARGFKPLIFGRSKEYTIVASESIVLDKANVALERDVYPGELIIFREDGSLQSYSIAQGMGHTHCFFEYVYFAHPASRIENQLVYDVRFRLGRSLAILMKRLGLEAPDYVVPVPDTSRPAAQALAEELNVPMREIILKNRYLGRTFITRTQTERDKMAHQKYLYLDDKIRGRNILVVDDSIVRGTTARMIVSDLRQRGARRVYFAVTCPPQNNPCYYGIDISTSRELIASDTDIDNIRRFIGADALIYQDMDGLVNAIGLHDNCLACLNGQYPTEHAKKIRVAAKMTGDVAVGRDYERVLE